MAFEQQPTQLTFSCFQMPVVSGRGPQGAVDCMMEALWISFILEHPTDSHLDWDMHCFKAGSTLWACVMVFGPIVLPGGRLCHGLVENSV